MSEAITIGVDLAKNVFQIHGVDAEGGVVFRRQLPIQRLPLPPRHRWRCQRTDLR